MVSGLVAAQAHVEVATCQSQTTLKSHPVARPGQLALLVLVSVGVHCPDARYLRHAGCPAVHLESGQMLHILDAFARSE